MTYSPCIQCKKLNRLNLNDHPDQKPVCGHCKSELPIVNGMNELSVPQMRLLIEKSPLPVVVDFWAPWCGPCQAFAPTFKQASKDLSSDVVFAKVNTEAHETASRAFLIRGIPSLILFEHGQEKGRQTGAVPFSSFVSWIRSLLPAVHHSQAG